MLNLYDSMVNSMVSGQVGCISPGAVLGEPEAGRPGRPQKVQFAMTTVTKQ
jgi:hypothetical protein